MTVSQRPLEETNDGHGGAVEEGVGTGKLNARAFDWRQARMLESRHGVGMARACVRWLMGDWATFECARDSVCSPQTILLPLKKHAHGDSHNGRTAVIEAHGRWRNETGEKAAVGP